VEITEWTVQSTKSPAVMRKYLKECRRHCDTVAVNEAVTGELTNAELVKLLHDIHEPSWLRNFSRYPTLIRIFSFLRFSIPLFTFACIYFAPLIYTLSILFRSQPAQWFIKGELRSLAYKRKRPT